MVSIDAARRQALGSHFTPAPDEAARLADLKAGLLLMAPHKAWQLPERPTWRENPFSDNNWQFQYHMLRWLDPLRRAADRGDAEAAEQWEFWARSWISANPPGAGRTKWSWIDMSDGIRAMELCHGLTVVGEQDWLVTSLHDHVAWLSEPSHLKRGNHGFHQHVGLLVLGVVLEDRSVTELALERLTAQLAAAYDEQGANEEGSIGYHLQNYVWWNEALTRLDREGIPRPELAHRLELAPRLLAHATSPLARFARIGDTDAGNPRKVDHPWTQFAATQGRRGEKPDSTTAVYDAGYAFLRSGWGEDRPFQDETYVTATWGRQDKVHGHRDGGSVTYASHGVQWIDDNGKYSYDSSPMRRYVVSRAAHNCVLIPGMAARRDTDVELVCSSDSAQVVDLRLDDPSYADVRLERRLVFLKALHQLLVVDQMRSDVAVTARQRWHLSPGSVPAASGQAVKMTHGSSSVMLLPLGPVPGGPRITYGDTGSPEGWTSVGWKRSRRTHVVDYEQTGAWLHWSTAIGPWNLRVVDVAGHLLASQGADVTVEELLAALGTGDDDLDLFPVPTSGDVRIRSNGSALRLDMRSAPGRGSFRIVDAAGKVVRSGRVSGASRSYLYVADLAGKDFRAEWCDGRTVRFSTPWMRHRGMGVVTA